MPVPPDIRDAFLQAKRLHAGGQLLEAERIYRSLASPGEHRPAVLESLADLFLQQHRLNECIQTLRALVEEQPDDLHYTAKLANLLDGLRQTQAAVEAYENLLERDPDLPVAHFNVALLYRKQKRYAQALAAYEEAIRLGIAQPEEAWLNMGILYSEMQQEENARRMYDRALEIVPDYIPALYNRAGHFEEVDEGQKAIEEYERILSLDPKHWDSMARLVYPRKITADNLDLVERLETGLRDMRGDDVTREHLCFALGKAYDDLERFDQASAAYSEANRLGKMRAAPYDQQRTAALFGQLIEMFDADWINSNESSSAAEPIFICGMFRSGSTLLEQMLASHPSVTAGGELEFLPWLIGTELEPFPVGVRNAERSRLQHVGNEYLRRVGERFPHSGRVTDKRPDNFLHLGLIRVLFPAARIVHTRRFVLDNCLSLYFQQLGNKFSYATDLGNCAHYIGQQQRLMEHWRSLLGDNIFSVDYESLVTSPEPVLRQLLDFLGLTWNPAVLEFHRAKSPVRTPSLWQVRQGLHTRSVGRWRNYEKLLGELTELARPGDCTA